MSSVTEKNDEDPSNYYEVHFVSKPGENHNIYKAGLSENNFYSLLNKVATLNYVHFQKEYKEYVYFDTVCQKFINNDIKVTKKQVIDIIVGDGILTIKYIKNKLSLLNFPSDSNLHYKTYVKHLLFMINNRIYLNFKITYDPKENEKIYSIFINYNHEINVDLEKVNNAIDGLIKNLMK